VIAAFSLAVYNGGNLLEAVDIARKIDKPHDIRFPELSDPCDLNAKALKNEILDLAESVKVSLLQMTSKHSVARAMADYPQAPYSDMVIISSFLLILSLLIC
jgi:hypothetical protein